MKTQSETQSEMHENDVVTMKVMRGFKAELRIHRWMLFVMMGLWFCSSFVSTAFAQAIVESKQGQPTAKGAWYMQGAGADGAAAIGFPVQTGGVDPATGLTQTFATDAIGQLRVLPAGGVLGSFAPDETQIAARPSTVNLAANVSGTIAGLQANRLYRVSCGAAAAYVSGAGPALATDNQLGAGMVENITVAAIGSISFISGSATTCYAGLKPL